MDINQAIEKLQSLGLIGQEFFDWLSNPSGGLSGDIPLEVMQSDPERAVKAMLAYASELEATK